MEYEPTPELRKLIPALPERTVFNTHEELDKYFKNLTDKVPTFRLDYSSECELLKSFDRAFWLRHLKKSHPSNAPIAHSEERKVNQNNGTVKIESITICDCPFGT